MAIIGIVTIFTALSLTGCDNDKEDKPCECNPTAHLEAGQTCNCGGDNCNCTEQPIAQQTATQITFVNTLPGYEATDTYNFTIKTGTGTTFTTAEWSGDTGIVQRVITALETANTNATAGDKARFRTVFSRECGVTIIIEKNPTDYTNYKVGIVGEDFKELYINVDKIEYLIVAGTNTEKGEEGYKACYKNAIVVMNAKDADSPLMKD